MKIIGLLKSIINRFFPDIKSSYNSAVTGLDDELSQWLMLYQGTNSKEIKSLNLPASIAEEFARLITSEMKTEIVGDNQRAKFLNNQYKNALKDIVIQVEKMCAMGGIVIKPYIQGKNIVVQYIQADCFIPISFDGSGRMTGGCFFEQIVKNNKYYTRIEKQTLENNVCIIENKAFLSGNDSELGREISLDEVPEWADIAETTEFKNVNFPLFVYLKTTKANKKYPHSPIGVSIYANAVNLIKEADKQFTSLMWEYEGGELAVDASESCLEFSDSDTFNMPKNKNRIFRKLSTRDDFYSVFAPTLRDNNYINGLNNLLKRIEFNCGLAYGTLSDPQNVDKTATEIVISKQRSYSTVCSMQNALENALKQLVDIMNVIADFYSLTEKGDYNVTFEWGDSVLTDSQSEQSIRLQEVSQGILSKEKYLQWRYGVTEEQAKEMIPKSENFFGEE